jgi:hypothetical protein
MRLLSIVGWIISVAVILGTVIAIVAVGAPIILAVATMLLLLKGF